MLRALEKREENKKRRLRNKIGRMRGKIGKARPPMTNSWYVFFVEKASDMLSILAFSLPRLESTSVLCLSLSSPFFRSPKHLNLPPDELYFPPLSPFCDSPNEGEWKKNG